MQLRTSGQAHNRTRGQIRYLSAADRALLLLIRLTREERWTAASAARELLAQAGIDRAGVSVIRAQIVRSATAPTEGLSSRMLLTLDNAELGLT